jgi:hypothetical protein
LQKFQSKGPPQLQAAELRLDNDLIERPGSASGKAKPGRSKPDLIKNKKI